MRALLSIVSGVGFTVSIVLVAACSSGSGNGDSPPTPPPPPPVTTGTIDTSAEFPAGLAELIALDSTRVAGHVDCGSGEPEPLTLSGGSSTGECIQVPQGSRDVTVEFTYDIDGVAVTLAVAELQVTVTADQSVSLPFNASDFAVADTNGSGLNDIDEAILGRDPRVPVRRS